MKRKLALFIAWVLSLGLVAGAVASAQSPEDHIAAVRALLVQAIDELDAIGSTGPTGPTTPTGPTSPTGPTAPTGPTPEEPCCPPIESAEPFRTPQQSMSGGVFYNVAIVDMSGDEQFSRLRFAADDGWEFYDRRHYSCVSTYLQAPDGERVARMVFRTADGVPGAYAGLNDRNGNEQNPNRTGYPSRCLIETPHGEPPTEVEPKPVGLEDTVVTFVVDGQAQTAFVCSEGAGHLDPETWCELEESEVGPNHVVVEVYWEDDLIIVIDIHRMSPRLEMVTGEA